MWFFIYTFILVPIIVKKILASDKTDEMGGGRGVLICIAGLIYCMGASISIHWRAESVMHQMYGALYSLMAVIFLCSAMLYFKLSVIAGNYMSEDKNVVNINELYHQAVKIVVEDEKTSVSHIQRNLHIGYTLLKGLRPQKNSKNAHFLHFSYFSKIASFNPTS